MICLLKGKGEMMDMERTINAHSSQTCSLGTADISFLDARSVALSKLEKINYVLFLTGFTDFICSALPGEGL
jgi:hypothetical protein